jgi:AraC-like DNA-binding protein
MVAAARRIELTRHRSALGGWETARAAPDPRLRGDVLEYCGYREETPGPLRRRELPVPMTVLIIELGPPLRVIDPRTPDAVRCHRAGFAAGIGDVYTITESLGVSYGVQVNLTPLGLYRLLGRPMSELCNEVVAIEDVLGTGGARLGAELGELPGWAARFARLDAFLVERMARGTAAGGDVAWAYGQIVASGGLVAIADLARELGLSRKRLGQRFREQVGMTPKPLARLVRFDRVMHLLRSGRKTCWTDVALDCGYSDQSHFNREFRAFSGGTPGEYLVRALPDGGGVLDGPGP